jgi:hypothetical protein
MNNSKLMIAVATAALIAGTSTVFAQQQGGAPGGAATGQMAPKSPGGGQTTGQPAAPGATHNGAAETKGGKNAAEERGESRANRAGEAQPNRTPTTGQAQQNERKEGQSNERRENRADDNKANQNKATEEKRLDQNRKTEEQGRDNDRSRTTTGQGAAPNKGSASPNITPEKRTQIHQVFVKERSAPRVDRVDFSLSVGTAVPRSVRFVPVPSTIVEIEPSWRGYDYFMVGDQIVIVDPRSLEIVAVIDA